MSDELTDYDMTLGSGIAAFEGKHFATAAGLLSPLLAAAAMAVAVFPRKFVRSGPLPTSFCFFL